MNDEYDKSEAPSPHKLEEARKKGQVRKSTDLVVWVTSVVALALIVIMVSRLAEDFNRFTRRMLQLYDLSLTPGAFYHLLSDAGWFALGSIVPLFLLFMLFSLAIQVVQTGFIWTGAQLKMDFTRLNPVAGIKKLFARKIWFDLAKNLLKLVVIGVVFYWVMPVLVSDVLEMSLSSTTQIRDNWVQMMVEVCGLLLLLLLPFSLFDFAFSDYDYMRKMRMSKKEVKDEYKNREGDPLVKFKQKQLQKELLKRTSSLAQVKDSDVIIVNPTHIAIALKFDKESMPSPKVLSAGKGEFAALIRQQARQYGVPVIQHKPLARMLYKECQIGGYVPGSCFGMLAPVFRWVLGMDQVVTTS